MWKTYSAASLIGLFLGSLASPVQAQACLEMTLTGTQGGPPVFEGQAGSGTLVTYGDQSNGCRDVLLQFDTGRGTTQSLSQIPESVADQCASGPA